MSTVMLQKTDASWKGVFYRLASFVTVSTANQFAVVDEEINTPRTLEYHNLNEETLQALEDVDSGVGVERASTIAEMVKKLDL